MCPSRPGATTDADRRIVATGLGILLSLVAVGAWLAVAAAVDRADGPAIVAPLGVVATVVAAWWGARLLRARGRDLGARMLAVCLLVWALATVVVLWSILIAWLGDPADRVWAGVGISVGLAALTWWGVRSLLRRPLASAAGALAVSFLVLLAGVVGVEDIAEKDRERAGAVSPAGAGQSDVQAAFLSDRAALHNGIVQTPERVDARVGGSHSVDATVCGGASPMCAGPEPVATATPPGKPSRPNTTPVSVGGRISAWATSSGDVRVSPAEVVVQPVIDASDSASWRWYVSPVRAGDLEITLHFRVLRGETDEALIPDRLVRVPVHAKEAPKSVAGVAQAGGSWFKDNLAWLIGLLGTLGITGPMIVNGVKRLRARRARRRVAG